MTAWSFTKRGEGNAVVYSPAPSLDSRFPGPQESCQLTGESHSKSCHPPNRPASTKVRSPLERQPTSNAGSMWICKCSPPRLVQLRTTLVGHSNFRAEVLLTVQPLLLLHPAGLTLLQVLLPINFLHINLFFFFSKSFPTRSEARCHRFSYQGHLLFNG